MPSGAKTRDEITAEATDWLVQLDAGTADAAAFEDWRNSDPTHAAIFAQVAATWQNVGALRFSAPGPTPASKPAVECDEAAAQTPAHHDASGSGRSRLGRRGAIGALAAGFAAVGVGTGFWLHDRRHFAETGIGERRSVRLPDGSMADLNTDTKIAWQMTETLEVWLERGEAALVVAGGRVTEAAGGLLLRARSMQALLERGSYNLRLRDEGPHLTVFSGRAEVRDNGQSTTLTANQVLRDSSAGFATDPLSAVDRQRADAWQRGEIVFDGMRLTDALGEFNRYLTQPIRVEDPAIGSIRLGGRFRINDPQGFLLSMEDAFGIGNRVQNGVILLYNKDNIS